MSLLLDIDLDYFNLMEDPTGALAQLLVWARCPVSFIVERHNHAFARWRRRVRAGSLPTPSHILHVDEHHDMMDEKKQANIAMQLWPECRVHRLVQEAIDSPAMWLSDETWSHIRPRFSHGPGRPKRWLRPDLVSVCTSPEFVEEAQLERLLAVVARFTA